MGCENLQSHKQLFYEYAALYRPYMNQLNAQLASFQLTVPLWLLMRVLYYEGGQTISQLSEKRNVEKPTTTKMVQRLEELQLVEARSGSDKRMRNIHLTEHGMAVSGQVEDELSRYQQKLVDGISEEEQLLAARVLRDISTNIKKNKG